MPLSSLHDLTLKKLAIFPDNGSGKYLSPLVLFLVENHPLRTPILNKSILYYRHHLTTSVTSLHPKSHRISTHSMAGKETSKCESEEDPESKEIDYPEDIWSDGSSSSDGSDGSSSPSPPRSPLRPLAEFDSDDKSDK
jgi:hypothetical protein